MNAGNFWYAESYGVALLNKSELRVNVGNALYSKFLSYTGRHRPGFGSYTDTGALLDSGGFGPTSDLTYTTFESEDVVEDEVEDEVEDVADRQEDSSSLLPAGRRPSRSLLAWSNN